MPPTSAGLNETRKGADWALLRAGSESLWARHMWGQWWSEQGGGSHPCAHINTMITSKVLDSQTRKPTTEVPLSCHIVRPFWTR